MKRIVLGLVAAAALAAAAPVLTTSALAQSVPVRDQNQQDRIAQGVRSGQLTPGETSRLEGREARINNREDRQRARNFGVLTNHDRRVDQRALNRDSRAIYRAKHNGRVD